MATNSQPNKEGSALRSEAGSISWLGGWPEQAHLELSSNPLSEPAHPRPCLPRPKQSDVLLRRSAVLIKSVAGCTTTTAGRGWLAETTSTVGCNRHPCTAPALYWWAALFQPLGLKGRSRLKHSPSLSYSLGFLRNRSSAKASKGKAQEEGGFLPLLTTRFRSFSVSGGSGFP
jgi:hypothetical protein